MGNQNTLLDPYVPRLATDWDLDTPGQRWKAVEGTLVFVDISGFTNLAERLARRGRIGAEELTGVLDHVFGRMLEIVFLRGGSLLKFGGDALLLLFDSPDHVLQATAATVEMRSTLRDAAKQKTSVGRIDLKMSSGIHTGAVDFFLVGESHRELLVTGPVASMTTSMESTAAAGEIVVSRAVKELLPADFIGEAKEPGWLLRKQKVHLEAAGIASRSMDHEPDLSTFVPRRLRDHLASGLTESEHRLATIGFVKFAGVDAMLAERGPEATARVLHDLIAVVGSAADREDVTFLASDIDAGGGKLILAAGVPSSQHDDEGRLLRTARSILDSDVGLQLRIGLNRGHVFAGDVGTKFRRTFTVMGDTVNLAARLMASAPVGGLYASPGVLDGSSTLYRSASLPPLLVKGKAEAVTAYEVFEELGVRPPETADALPFRGREAEIEMLVSIVTTCARVGRGGTMAISGPTGIGKSRLIAEVIDRCPGLATVTVKAEPNGSDIPYWAMRDPMRSALGVERGSNEEMTAALSRCVAGLNSSLLPLLPLLGDVLHVEIEDTDQTSDIDPQFRPERTADVVIELLSSLYPDEPLAVIAEDSQWLDEASRSLLSRLGRAAETRPWTVLMTRRDESDDSDGGVVGEIALGPLDRESMRQIAITATAAAPLRPHELDGVIERAGGNPLFLSEILTVVRESGSVENLPDSLDSVVSRQIDTLPPLARQILRYASVLGNSFPTLVLEEFLSRDEFTLDEATRERLSTFITSVGEDRLRFRNTVTHDVAYRGLSFRRRRELHDRAGEVVESMAAADLSASAEFLAYHFSEAGVHQKTWEYAGIAASKAREAYANAEAATQYERALEAASHLAELDHDSVADMWTGLGTVLDQIGDYEGARKAFSRAADVARDDDVRIADLYLRRAESWVGSGDVSQAKRNITIGRKRLDGDRSGQSMRAMARLEAYEAGLHAGNGDFAKAKSVALSAAELAEASGEEEALAKAYSVLDAAYFMLGLPDERPGTRAIEIYERLGLHERMVGVMNNMGAFAYWEGDWNAAVEWYEKAIHAAERSGNIHVAALAMANTAEVLVGQRRYPQAKTLLEESERIFLASRSSSYLPLISMLKARVMLGSGDAAGAIRDLEPLVDRQLSRDATEWTPDCVVTLAEALLALGDADGAADSIRRFRTSHPAMAVNVEPAILRILGLASIVTGDISGGLDKLEASLEAARGDLQQEALSLEALARATGLEDEAAASARARQAELFQQLGIESELLTSPI